MPSIIVTTSAFGTQQVLEKGQEYFVPIVALAGAKGIEIRRELFAEPFLPLDSLRKAILKHGLETIYSAPISVWKSDGSLNWKELTMIIQEAIQLGAGYLKASLGTYHPPQSSVLQLKELLSEVQLKEKGLTLMVENDQTEQGGKIRALQSFFEACKSEGIPVPMTFDIGNWEWHSEDPFQAAAELKEYVIYIHCKEILIVDGKKVTVPLSFEENAHWRSLLSTLGKVALCGIEFPLEGEQLEEVTKQYVSLLASVTEKGETSWNQ